MVFVESSTFTRDLPRYMVDEEYRRLQVRLLGNPRAGAVMRGCGGLRKMRAPDRRRGEGTRGGLRVIYLWVPEVHCVLLLDIYDKAEQDDLTPDQRRRLALLAAGLRDEVLRRTRGR